MTPAGALVLPPADCYVVIDTFRATTTMAVMFERGLASLLAVEDIPAARLSRERDPEALLFGEVKGMKPEGFDYGNSPAEAVGLGLAGRRAIHATTNGTRALCAVADRGVTFTGALVNARAVAEHAAEFERVVLVCSGNGGANQFSLEDYAAAAAIAQALTATHSGIEYGDAAIIADALADPVAIASRSEHAQVLRNFGFHADLEYALRMDTIAAVPIVRDCGPGWARLERA